MTTRLEDLPALRPQLLANDAHANSESTRGYICSKRNDSQHGLDCLYLNSRSLKAFVKTDDNCSKICKINIFQQLVYCGGYDVVCVCETWLNDCVLDSELLPGYSIFRRDRVGKTGGGVLVAVRDTIRAKRRTDLEGNNVELVVVELFKANNQSIILYTFYRPPSSTLDSIQQLNSSLDNIPESMSIILIGNFNLPTIDWSLDHPNPNNNGGLLENKFCDLVGDHFLEQLISGSTHRDGNKLDLLLCNYAEIIKNVTSSTPEQFGFPTDHHIIEFEIPQNFSRAKPIKRIILDYRQGNFEELRTSLLQAGFDSDGVLTEEIDQHWTRWKEWFLAHVNKFIPKKVVKDTNSPPWVDGELFWSYHKSTCRHRESKVSEISYKGVTAKTAAHKAELFNAFFSSVFTSPRSNIGEDTINNSLPLRTEQNLSDITIGVEEVANCLHGLDTSKASGPDDLPSRLLKECAQ
ncbi:Hypothetical predicted protein [Paramuricea clavata]|nr:Hypothetical predicted protein [Paramuricea clavata]